MNTGEIISTLALCSSDWHNGYDELLMQRNVCNIDVKDEYIEVYFVDGNTNSIRIYKTGWSERIA